MQTTVEMTLAEVHDLAYSVLRANGLSEDHARTLADSMTKAERDECRSHGLFRLIMCTNSLRGGKVALDAEPEIVDHAPGIAIADAKRGFSLLAFEKGLPVLVDKAKRQGIAILAVRNCFHFSALWPEVEEIAAYGLVGLATNPSHAWVAPPGGTGPALGTNPLAFAWPRPNSDPFVFDFATSAMARGDIELHAAGGKPLPPGTALDRFGHPTTDATAALAGFMLPFGGHKGFALSLMIELIAGPLIGDLTSVDSLAFDAGDIGAPFHGELILAIDPHRMGGEATGRNMTKAEGLLDLIADQGTRLPSQRRLAARARTLALGHVLIEESLLDRVSRLRSV